MFAGIQNQLLPHPFPEGKTPEDTKNTKKHYFVNHICFKLVKRNYLEHYVKLTNLRRHVFSRRAPTHPAKLTMNTTAPAINITRDIFKTTS